MDKKPGIVRSTLIGGLLFLLPLGSRDLLKGALLSPTAPG
jgi:hypothetical protein